MLSTILATALVLQVPVDTAQGSGRPCQVAIDNMPRAAQTLTGPDTNYFGAGGVRAHCLGTGTTIAADSFAHYSASQSEEHTSELQSPCNLVCRLLLEKKNKKQGCVY